MAVQDADELQVDLFILVLRRRLSNKQDSVPGSQELSAYAAILVSGQAMPREWNILLLCSNFMKNHTQKCIYFFLLIPEILTI